MDNPKITKVGESREESEKGAVIVTKGGDGKGGVKIVDSHKKEKDNE